MVDAEKKIDRMRHLVREKAYVEKELGALSAPLSDDIGLADEMYRVFLEGMAEVNPSADPASRNSRKKFIFVAMYVFSPPSLVGKKLKKGLRDKLAELFAVRPTSLSHSVEDIPFLYMSSRSFRRDANHILERVMDWLAKRQEKDLHIK